VAVGVPSILLRATGSGADATIPPGSNRSRTRRTGEPLPVRDPSYRGLAMAPDGSPLATGDANGLVQFALDYLWDRNLDRQVTRLGDLVGATSAERNGTSSSRGRALPADMLPPAQARPWTAARRATAATGGAGPGRSPAHRPPQ
jgi:hypothetical protein